MKHVGTDQEKISIGNLEVSYYQKVDDSTNVGSKIVTSLVGKDTKIEVGGDYQLDKDSLVKAKVDSDGNIGLAYSRVVSEELRASVAAEIKAQSLLSQGCDNTKFGVRFDYYYS